MHLQIDLFFDVYVFYNFFFFANDFDDYYVVSYKDFVTNYDLI